MSRPGDIAEESLPSGAGNAGQVVRVGDTVRRPVGPQTPAVQAFLAHLHERGFTGAPRPLGYDEQGREVLTYVPGDVSHEEEPPDWCRTDDALVSVVTLVREMHDAARGFVPPDDAEWAWPRPPEYRTDLVAHNDPCRSNVVFTGGRASAFIDFDFAGPSTPEWEMAGVLFHWAMRIGDDPLARIRLALDVYPLDPVVLTRTMLVRNAWGMNMVRTRAMAGEPGFVAMWADGVEGRIKATGAWVAEHLPHGITG